MHKLTILISEIQKFSEEGAQPPPQTSSPVGRVHHVPTPQFLHWPSDVLSLVVCACNDVTVNFVCNNVCLFETFRVIYIQLS